MRAEQPWNALFTYLLTHGQPLAQLHHSHLPKSVYMHLLTKNCRDVKLYVVRRQFCLGWNSKLLLLPFKGGGRFQNLL